MAQALNGAYCVQMVSGIEADTERLGAFNHQYKPDAAIQGQYTDSIHIKAEAKENHGLLFARMLGIENMREPCFLTAAVQNMKRLVKAFFLLTVSIWQPPAFASENRGLLMG